MCSPVFKNALIFYLCFSSVAFMAVNCVVCCFIVLDFSPPCSTPNSKWPGRWISSQLQCNPISDGSKQMLIVFMLRNGGIRLECQSNVMIMTNGFVLQRWKSNELETNTMPKMIFLPRWWTGGTMRLWNERKFMAYETKVIPFVRLHNSSVGHSFAWYVITTMGLLWIHRRHKHTVAHTHTHTYTHRHTAGET